MPAKPVTRTPQEVAAKDLHAAIRHELGQVPMQCASCRHDWYGLRDTACRPVCAHCGTALDITRPSK